MSTCNCYSRRMQDVCLPCKRWKSRRGCSVFGMKRDFPFVSNLYRRNRPGSRSSTNKGESNLHEGGRGKV